MNLYLSIITTILVLTQIIRVTQNAIQLMHQHTIYKRNIAQLDVTDEDIKRRKQCDELVIRYLKEYFLEENK